MIEDSIIEIGESRLQYGPLSDRAYLMHLGPEDGVQALAAMEQLADENGYTKLFAKIPAKTAGIFMRRGFEIEARIPDFFPDGEEALFVSRFLSQARRRITNADHIRQVLAAAKAQMNAGILHPLPAGTTLISMSRDHADKMAALYRKAFKSYPFPIFDPMYLRSTMEENFRYFGIFRNGALLALASTETNAGGVEMTDFATDRTFRKAGLAGHLLAAMETDACKSGAQTAFTIARAGSYGINILFARAGYAFSGTLINNTNISGQMESMNVWYKPLGVA